MASSGQGKGKDAGDADAFMAALEHPRKAEIEALRKLFPPDKVQVVLHTGAKSKSNSATMTIDDPSRLLEWAAKDRCVATFASLEDIEAGKKAFTAILRQWIAQL